MQEHNHKEKEHKHDGCCGHDHGHHHVHGHDAQHAESHDHHHEHSHHHTHTHHEHHAHHGHEHHHGHECCDHDHGHGHKHLSAHECTTLFNQAQSTHDTAQAIALLIESGCGFAHLGDSAATAAVNGLLSEKIKAPAALTHLQKAQINALKALELALSQTGGKEALAKSVDELENFSGSERAEVEQLLADVRKALAGIRTTGLKSLLSKLKF